MAGIIAPEIVTDGLAFCIDAANARSYITGSSTCNDLSGNGNTGTFTNGTTFSSGNPGAFTFDGVDDYIDCGNGTSLQITGNITIVAWVNPINFSVFHGIVGKTLSGVAAPYDYYISTSGIPTLVRGNGTVFQARAATNACTANVWQQVAVTQSGTAVTHYLNGNSNGTPTLSTTIGNAVTNLRVGSRDNGFTKFNGRIAQVSMYNRALSASEILQNYNTLKIRFGL